LHGFRTYSASLVPEGSVLAWIDASNHQALIFSVVCIIANTITQIVTQRFSPMIGRQFDYICRICLPIAYILGQALMFVLTSVDPLILIIFQSILGIFMIAGLGGLLWRETQYLHHVVLRHYCHRGGTHLELEQQEAKMIFDKIDADGSGCVSPTEVMFEVRRALGPKNCPLSDEELDKLLEEEFKEHEREPMTLEIFLRDHKKLLHAITDSILRTRNSKLVRNSQNNRSNSGKKDDDPPTQPALDTVEEGSAEGLNSVEAKREIVDGTSSVEEVSVTVVPDVAVEDQKTRRRSATAEHASGLVVRESEFSGSM
jgi:hypothetical protein